MRYLRIQNIYIYISSLLVILFFLGFLRDLVIPIYDHDLDTEMYFGSRLLNGELIYTREMNDKLPVVQYIFAFPSLLKEYRLFTFINGTLSILGAIFFKKTIYTYLIFRYRNFRKKFLFSISVLSSCIYLYLNVSIYGGLNHISSLSSNLTIIVTSVYIYSYLSKSKLGLINKFAILIISSIAISIRQYLILPIVLPPSFRIMSWIDSKE